MVVQGKFIPQSIPFRADAVGIRYSGSLFPSNLCKFFDFCLGFNCCQGVRFCGVSARRELTVYQSAFTQTSIRLSLFSKDVKVEQSFNYSGCLFHKLAALNTNYRFPRDCLILGNIKFLLLFFVSLTWTALNLKNVSAM